MGRAFEFRKARKMKRWSAMAKTFTRIGKDIVMAVKEGGPNAETNSRLRAVIQNAKAANMPKDNVERAIKKASDKDTANFKEVLFEGYAPHGIAILIETATDNTNRTVANVRSYFNKTNGALGKTGSLDFVFSRKSIFRFLPTDELDLEELEFELIDAGLEELYVEADEDGNDVAVAQAAFENFGPLQKALEEKGIELKSSKLERIALSHHPVTEEQALDVLKLIDKLEEDDDVQAVYHNMAE
jgi:YebC/PmpR family DNA-binding regulatory protein